VVARTKGCSTKGAPPQGDPTKGRALNGALIQWGRTQGGPTYGSPDSRRPTPNALKPFCLGDPLLESAFERVPVCGGPGQLPFLPMPKSGPAGTDVAIVLRVYKDALWVANLYPARGQMRLIEISLVSNTPCRSPSLHKPLGRFRGSRPQGVE
jgi:hypothetical protein